jgi:hypothetical protein
LSSDARLTEQTLSSASPVNLTVLAGVGRHPIAKADKPVLVAGRHGVRQLPKLKSETLQFLAERIVTHQWNPPHLL